MLVFSVAANYLSNYEELLILMEIEDSTLDEAFQCPKCFCIHACNSHGESTPIHLDPDVVHIQST
jgi:hypothetical protein